MLADSLNELTLNVRYADRERDTRLANALERATTLSARLDALLARGNYKPNRPLWVGSKPRWERVRVSLPTSARDVAFAQLVDSRKAA